MSVPRRSIAVMLWMALLAPLVGGDVAAAPSGLTGYVTITDSAHYTADTTAAVATAQTTCTLSITLHGADQATATVSYSAQHVLDQKTPGTEGKLTTEVRGSGTMSYDAGARVAIGQDGTYQITLGSPEITANVTETREITNQPTTTTTSTEPVRCAIGNDEILTGRLGHAATLNGSQIDNGRFGNTGQEYGSSTARWSITDPLYHPDPGAPLPPAPSGPPPGIHLAGNVSVTDQASYDNTSSALSTSAQTNCTITITLSKDGSATATATYTAHEVRDQSSAGIEDKLTTDVQGTGTFYYAAYANASIAQDGSYQITLGSPEITANVTETREITNQPTTTTTSTEPVRCAIGNDGLLVGHVVRNSNILKGQVDEHGHFGNTGEETGTSSVRWTIVDVYIAIKVGSGKHGGSPTSTPTAMPPALTDTATATPTARGKQHGGSPSPTPTSTSTSCARDVGMHLPDPATLGAADLDSSQDLHAGGLPDAGSGRGWHGAHWIDANILPVLPARRLRQGAGKSCAIDIYVNNRFSTRLKTRLLVGAKIILSVRVNGKLATGKIAWSIPVKLSGDLPSAVGNYTLTTRSEGAEIEEFNSRLLSQPTFGIYFMRAPAQGSAYRVKVTTTAGSTWTDLQVESPHLTRPAAAVMCEVAVNRTVSLTGVGGSDLRPPTLGLGLNDRCPSQWGIAWDYKISVPKIGAGGEIGMTQLIERRVIFNEQRCKPDVPTWKSDDSSFFGNHFVQLGPGAIGYWRGHDAPNISLRSFGTFTEEFAAHDFIMFRPSVPEAIWVPLAELDWSWTGTANHDLINIPGVSDWKLVRSSKTPTTSPITVFALKKWPAWKHIQPNAIGITCP